METLEAIEKRHSVRDFLSKKVENEKLIAILDAAIRAPSGMNRQPWHFLVLTEEESRKKALSANSTYNRWMNNAPAIIVVLADSSAFYGREEQKMYLLDLGLAIENLLIAATELGLGACITIGFSAEKLQNSLEIPKRYIPVAVVPVGYESEEKFADTLIKGVTHSINKKKNFEEVVSFEQL